MNGGLIQEFSRFALDPQISVADLLMEHPTAIPAFLSRRMACVGCSMARFETLSSASGIYGINLSEFLAEIEHIINPKP